MKLDLYDIIPQLQPYVKAVCSMENADVSSYCSPFRVLPDTCAELFIHFTETEQTITSVNIVMKQPQSFIVSRMSHYMDVSGHGRPGCIAVCFHPGAASHFFQTAMHELSDDAIDLYDLWKNTASEMEEKVMCAGNNHERASIVQQYLLDQLVKQKENHELIKHWLWQVNLFKGQITVEELSRKANISQRQLGRHFNQVVGLSPKEFMNVTRFIHSLTHLKKYPAVSLTEVAYDSGYYDQAHFIHDYKRYAGLTPGELLASANILY